ncbi:MAG: caspase family protein [Gammaproteobacteria bacterium]|nr:caspase family protein [Gammaproteobacteria bacterium]
MKLKILFTFIFSLFTINCFSVEYSDSCGKEWEWLNPLPHGNHLRDVSWSSEQNQFIAVGDVGTVLSSTDGENWIKQDSKTKSSLYSIAWNTKFWMAVGLDGTILSSTNGIDWQVQHSSTTIALYSIAWHTDTWMAVGVNGTILSSTDGINWQAQDSKTTITLHSVAWAGSTWKAVGSNGTILSSSDGVIWQEQQIGGIVIQTGVRPALLGIAWHNDEFAVVTDEGEIELNQADGSWSGFNPWLLTFTSKVLYGISSNDSTWVAVGQNGTIFSRNHNGNEWLEETSGISETLYGVTGNGTTRVAVGQNGIIISSNKGESWQRHSSGTTKQYYTVSWNSHTTSLNDIAWNGNTLMTVGSFTSILSNSDGVNWKDINLRGTTFDPKSITWSGNFWITTGSSGSIYISFDGLNWESQNTGTKEYLWDIAWNGKQFIAVGDKSTILMSSDGVNWVKQTSIPSERFTAIAWNGKQWIIVGYSGTILSSSDGVYWKLQSSGTTVALQDIAWNGSRWMAVGRVGIVLSSSDGKNWDEINSGISEDLFGITSNGSLWVAVGRYGNIISTYDEVNWHKSVSGTRNTLSGITWTGSHFITVGAGGTIITSPCYSKNNFRNTRSLIVSGGGDPDDYLQSATNENANLAYRTLRQRGISASNIKYFNAIPQDADSDGVIDTESGVPTKASIQSAITSWLASSVDEATPVLVYLIDHGGENIFYLNKPSDGYAEVIKASEFQTWFDSLQSSTNARMTVVYDACHAGSFMDDLKQSGSNKYDRSLLFSSAPEQLAYFGAQGGLSYSHFFWNNIGQGMDVRTAHRSATVAVRATTQNDGKSYQQTLLDDNGDGEENYVDGSLARDTYLGVNTNETLVYPTIVKHRGSSVIDIKDNGAVDLFARVDLSKDQIERVWAIVIPPNSKTTGSEAVTELPVIELDSYDAISGEYRASSDTSTVFNQSGQYTVSYYAKTKGENGKEGVNSRFPLVSLITVTDSGYKALNQSEIQAIIIGGGNNNNPSFAKAITHNTELAYQSLRARGVNKDNIYYLAQSTADVDGDGQTDTQGTSSTSAYNQAINWASTKVNSTTPLLIYFIGYGEDRSFYLNNTETLTATALANDLNTLQSQTSARVTTAGDY